MLQYCFQSCLCPRLLWLLTRLPGWTLVLVHHFLPQLGLSMDLVTCTHLCPLGSDAVGLCLSKGTAGTGVTLGSSLVEGFWLLLLPDTELLTYSNIA